MSPIIPPSRPRETREEVEKIIAASGVVSDVVIVGVRGYYRNSMGKPGANDRGIYDDAIFVVSPEAFAAFNANCDPSIFKKDIATLKPGVYQCVKWKHHGKVVVCDALQIVRDVLTRDGETGEFVGRHGINFHYGSDGATWSEGCQTVPKSQFQAFITLVYSEMNRHAMATIPYILVENK